MSDVEPALEPVPVTKDTTSVVNGEGEPDLPPPQPELTNGINGIEKADAKMSNGDVEGMNGDHGLNGEGLAAPVPPPVNGEMDPVTEAQEVTVKSDIAETDDIGELPPPPGVMVSDLPPPPPEECDNGNIESSVDPVPDSNVDQGIEVESNADPLPEPSESSVDPVPAGDADVDALPVEDASVDPGVESSVDPEVVDDQCADNDDDLMNVSDTDEGKEDRSHLPPPGRLVEAVSEEELVSTTGLKEEMEADFNQEVEAEKPVPEPLLDLGVSVDPPVEEQPQVSEQPPLLDLGNDEGSSVDAPAPPEVEQQGQLPAETTPQPVPVPTMPEPVVETAPEGVVPAQEETPVPEQEVPVFNEPEPQAQVGYAEPDIIVDNKPEVEVEESPPPPPPPLVEETPPPPPPSLDDSVPLRRVSGGSTPSKESNTSFEATTPVSVAVVPPQPDQPREPSPKPTPTPPASPTKEEPPATPPAQPVVQASQPVAVVAPQVQGEASEEPSPQVSEPRTPPASPVGSTPGSPSSVSIEGDVQPTTSPQVSAKINKKNFKNKIKFGVDLVEASVKQLHFLKIVNNNEGLYEEWLFKKAIRRYEAFWLPLAAEHKKECLAAPLDIEWVWHCHMLAPLAYEADCKNQVGLLVEHKLISEKDRTKALEKSKKYWTAKYPKEPFEIDLIYKEKVVEEVTEDKTEEAPSATQEADKPTEAAGNQDTENAGNEGADKAEPAAEGNTQEPQAETATTEGEKTEAADVAPATQEPAPAVEQPAEPAKPAEPEVPEIPEEGYEQRSVYNIFRAISRQRVFFYQTSLAHFHDKQFLKTAQKRYQRFLFLKHQNPTEVLVPCYDIDVMWHSHQLHPGIYKHDTTKVLGQTLVHDDSINDRAAGSSLNRADQKTRDLWKNVFGDSLMTFGAMFRGEPPVLCEKMALIDPKDTFAFSTKKATVNLDKVQVEGLPEEVNKYSVKLAYGANEREGPMIKQFKGNKKKVEFENTKKGLAHFVFDTKEYDRLQFNMSQQIGFACTGHDEEIGRQEFNLMPVVESIPKDKSDPSSLTDTVTIDIDEGHNLKATFSATIEPPKQGPTMLFMCPGNFETRMCIMPEQIVQMWGPIPLPRLPTGFDNQCIVASHKFANHTGEITFTCRVIHSLPMLMSAIQVFYQSHISAVAHLVGSDQIPLPSQLSDPKRIFSLNPEDGQRALLIKNQTGDWGILKGQWTGFRKHQPAVAATKGKKAKKEVAWNPGTLNLAFYKCSTGAWQHLTLPYQQENYRITIQDANVDLRTGTIEIHSDSNEVAENLALAFSVAMLHVMCQPRYVPPPPPEPIAVTVEEAPTPEVPPPSSGPEVPQATEVPAESEGGKVETPAADTTPAAGEAPDTAPPAEGDAAQTQAAADDSKPADKPADEKEPEAEKPKEEKPKEEKPKTPAKTPKSPTKSEPQTPSKKVKEIPPIPTYDLYMVLAAGYNVDTPTNDHIQKMYGANACAGCVAMGIDVGVGKVGQAAAETNEVAETGDANDAGEGESPVDDAPQQVGEGDAGDQAGAEADVMDAGADAMGDAGAAACAAF